MSENVCYVNLYVVSVMEQIAQSVGCLCEKISKAKLFISIIVVGTKMALVCCCAVKQQTN